MTWKAAVLAICVSCPLACTTDLGEQFGTDQQLTADDDALAESDDDAEPAAAVSDDILTNSDVSEDELDAAAPNDPLTSDDRAIGVQMDASVSRTFEAGSDPISDVQPPVEGPPMSADEPQVTPGDATSEAGAVPTVNTQDDPELSPPTDDDSFVTDAGASQPTEAGVSEQPTADAACGDEPSQSDCAPVDACPDDPDKVEPGVCGCGVADLDSDADGALDCLDDCPQDVNKVEAGHCGCGISDAEDADSDGEPDCTDECPDDVAKVLPGNCGCGTAESVCEGLAEALVHRYSFNGTSATLLDSVGGADGAAMETTLTGNGRLELEGRGSGQYGQLPTAVLDGLIDATFEVWLEWNGEAGAWERILDIGRGGPVNPGEPGVDFFLVSVDGAGSVGLSAGVFLDGRSEDQVDVANSLPRETLEHVVVVFDDTGNTLDLYRDGQLLASAALSSSFQEINAEFFWLGQSQFSGDPTFLGAYEELRIYSKALSPAEIAASARRGPDATIE